MGLPELPDQNEEIDFRMEENIVINTDGTTDDSENEYNEENAYMGYQPLNMRDMNSMMEDSDTSESNDPEIHDDDSIELLNVDVWNAPRPNELNIELGPEKAEQILSVMAGIKLPSISVPQWAQGIPEESWKEELLRRIRERHHNQEVEDNS
ncbi:male-enhanced antigen 1 [Armigeres subalbatus]|uniref:male-enhanced antigen 1 n=1 Tax=Armigeres subalbatus TaxID=124917 RepID=UPI002ED34387